jgi:tetratricopeptide (TPR) repeat protein
LRRAIGDPADIAETLSTLSVVRLRQGHATSAREGETEALAIFRELGRQIEEAIVLLHLGEICFHTGDDAEAQQYLEQSLALAIEVRYEEIERDCEKVLGQIALEHADLRAARARFGRALDVCRAAADRHGEATSLWWLGKVDVIEGDFAAARERLGEALKAFRSFEMRAEMVGCVEDHGRLANALGHPQDATRLLAAAAAARETLVLTRPPRAEQRWAGDVATLREVLGPAFEAAWNEGSAWSLERAIVQATKVR